MSNKMGGYQWWVVFLLWGGCVIQTLDQGSLAVAAPYIMKELDMSPVMMGFALSSFWWTYCAMNIPLGLLADKIGAKKALGWSAFAWSFITALTGLANNYITLIAFRLGLGASEAALQPINFKVAKETFSAEQRGTAVGLFNSGKRVGLAIVPIIVTYLMSAWSWRVAFYITGIASLGWVALWFFTFRDVKSDPAASAAASEKVPWMELIKNRTILSLFTSKFFQDYMYIMFVSWLPSYLVMERGFTVIKMGWYVSIPWIVTFCALPLVGMLSDTLIKRGMSVTKARKGVIIGGHLIASTIVFAVYTDSPVIAIVLMTIAVAAESAASTMLLVATAEVAPKKVSGAVIGFVNTAGGLAGIVAPVITGFLLSITGNFQQAFLVSSIFIIIAALTMWKGVGKIEQIELGKKEVIVGTNAS
ncbi:MAG: putative transporter [Firmicutes bacterium]|nr:putative transporter [Bacillota bacterium]